MIRSIRRAPRRRRSLIAAASLALLVATSACAQGGGTEGGATTQRTVGAAAGAAELDSVLARAEHDRSKGSPTAPVTLFEISDFQCPYCREFAATTYPKLDSAYIKTGKVRLVFINYPLPNHREAWSASEAALCAGAQGAFWPMHDRIFATQREWSDQPDAGERFARYAADLKLDAAALRACMADDRVSTLIVNDVMQAAGAGIQGTPTFLVNGRSALRGAVPFDQLAAAIDQELAGASTPGTPPAQPQQTPAPTP